MIKETSHQTHVRRLSPPPRQVLRNEKGMIERYTIKFGPAVSQKELEKLLSAGEGKVNSDDLKKVKARIAFVGDFDDLREVSEFIKKRTKHG